MFLPTFTDDHWSSSTPDGTDHAYAWIFGFNDATTGAGHKAGSMNQVRARSELSRRFA